MRKNEKAKSENHKKHHSTVYIEETTTKTVYTWGRSIDSLRDVDILINRLPQLTQCTHEIDHKTLCYIL